MISTIIKNAFLSVVGVSVETSLIAMTLMLCKPLLNRRYAAKWMYGIWIALAVRLVIPFHWDFSAMQIVQNNLTNRTALLEFTIPEELVTPVNLTMPTPTEPVTPVNLTMPTEFSPAVDVDTTDSKYQTGAASAKEVSGSQYAESNVITILDILAAVWSVGSILFLVLHLCSYLYYKRQILTKGKPIACTDNQISALLSYLREELRLKQNIKAVKYANAASPMVIGFWHPVLVLPENDYDKRELFFILKHELVHLKRHDVCMKLLFVSANALHWFNPIIYLMRREASVDMELSCDERVVSGGSYAVRKAYTETLLSTLHKQCVRKTALSTQFYGGTKIMKKRFKNILTKTTKKNGKVLFACTMAATLSLGMLVGYSMPNPFPQMQTVADARAVQSSKQNTNAKKKKESSKSKQTKIVCEVKDGVILSADAKQVKRIMKTFANAYFQGDTDSIRGCLSDNYSWDIEVYKGAADKVSDATLKGFQKINGIYSYVSLEFKKNAKSEAVQCLEASLIKEDEGWKIYSYGLLSEDAQEIKGVVTSFATAYFYNRLDDIRSCLADSYEQEISSYESAAGEVSVLALKGLDRVSKHAVGDTCTVSLEYKDAAVDDTFQYLSITLIKQENGWKIVFYGNEG